MINYNNYVYLRYVLLVNISAALIPSMTVKGRANGQSTVVDICRLRNRRGRLPGHVPIWLQRQTMFTSRLPKCMWMALFAVW